MISLRVVHLNQSFSGRKIIDDISLEACQGSIIVLLGPNGAGKTTLLKTIIGLNRSPKPDSVNGRDQIFFNNTLINTWPVWERVSNGLIYLPQQSSLFSGMTVTQNLELVFEYYDYWKGRTKDEFYRERDHWLEQMGLSVTRGQRAQVLSGGQKRKLEVVRSLLMHPSMIMLDEPFAGVDPKSIYELKAIFSSLASQKIGFIISDHHVDQLLAIAHTIYVIIQGKVVTHGSIEEILANEDTQKKYFGNEFYEEMSYRFLGKQAKTQKDEL